MHGVILTSGYRAYRALQNGAFLTQFEALLPELYCFQDVHSQILAIALQYSRTLFRTYMRIVYFSTHPYTRVLY